MERRREVRKVGVRDSKEERRKEDGQVKREGTERRNEGC